MNGFEVRYQLLKAVILIVIALGLGACSGGGNSSGIGANNFAPTAGASSSGGAIGGQAASSAQKIFAANGSGGGAGKGEDYRISGLDVLQVTVLGLKDLDSTVQVSTSGMISLPLVKTIKAGGRTTAELEQEIAKRLQATYLQAPQVSVFIKEYNSQRVTVDGAVIKPGIFPITGKMSLLQAIALAEGLSKIADPTGVVVFRQVNGQRMAARFDLKQVRGGRTADPNLVAGDIVMVDESAARTTLRDVSDVLPLSGLFRLF